MTPPGYPSRQDHWSTQRMRTQVVIVGAGPAGLMLSHLLAAHSISSVVIERRTKAYVLSRIRAGVLESGTVQMLREYGLGTRMDREGTPHDGVLIEWPGQRATLIDGPRYAGKAMMVYGQTQITEDLYAAREAAGQTIIEEAENVVLNDLQGKMPHVIYERNGHRQRIDCDYVAGCDGSHGVSRTFIPAAARTEYERVYPFGWLGVLAAVPRWNTSFMPTVGVGSHSRHSVDRC